MLNQSILYIHKWLCHHIFVEIILLEFMLEQEHILSCELSNIIWCKIMNRKRKARKSFRLWFSPLTWDLFFLYISGVLTVAWIRKYLLFMFTNITWSSSLLQYYLHYLRINQMNLFVIWKWLLHNCIVESGNSGYFIALRKETWKKLIY